MIHLVINILFRGGLRRALKVEVGFNLKFLGLSDQFHSILHKTPFLVITNNHFQLYPVYFTSCCPYYIRPLKVNVRWPENPKCNSNVAPVFAIKILLRFISLNGFKKQQGLYFTETCGKPRDKISIRSGDEGRTCRQSSRSS